MSTYIINDKKGNRLFSFEHENLADCLVMVHSIKDRKTEQLEFDIKVDVNESEKDIKPKDETVEYFYKGDYADGIEVRNAKGHFGITIRKEID